MLSTAKLPILLCAFALLANVARAGAQTCAGDCNGDTAVTIGELIRAVNIALALAPVGDCAAADGDGNGSISIAELIQAVNRALLACPPTPSPSATPTVTPTSTVTDTPTASPTPTLTGTPTATPSATGTETATATPTSADTPTPTETISYPDVSGIWREEPLQLVSSTCLEIIAEAFAEELAQRPACDHQVSNVDNLVTVVDCNNRAVIGDLDTFGVITYSLPEDTGSVDACELTLNADVRIPAGLTPTTATYVFEIAFGGSCPLPTCNLTAAGRWTLIGE